MTICVRHITIANRMRQLPIQSNEQNYLWGSNCPQLEPHTLNKCWSSCHQSLNLQESVIIAGMVAERTQPSATKEENNVALQQYGQTPCV
jgi:hypothetical protein